MKTRELTRLNNAAAIRTFNISPDGDIVFDRLRGNHMAFESIIRAIQEGHETR